MISNPPGTGNVVGPASATDNAIARFDATTGKLLQNSLATLDDAGKLTVPQAADLSAIGSFADTTGHTGFTLAFNLFQIWASSGKSAFFSNTRVELMNGVSLGLSGSGAENNADCWLTRLGAALMVLGSGSGAQGLKVDASGANTEISSASGDLHISSLPTSNPGPGILWNNLGVPAIGT